MFKKVFSILLAFSLIIFCGLIPYANALGFVDVPSNSSYLDGVNYVSDNGYMTGIGSNQFAPGNNMTRATFVQTLYAYAGKPTVNQTLPFTDIPSGAYYIAAVKWAYKNGIISGTMSTVGIMVLLKSVPDITPEVIISSDMGFFYDSYQVTISTKNATSAS